jgi:hypothetical protein
VNSASMRRIGSLPLASDGARYTPERARFIIRHCRLIERSGCDLSSLTLRSDALICERLGEKAYPRPDRGSFSIIAGRSSCQARGQALAGNF